MTRLSRDTNLDAFIQCQYTELSFKKKNMGQCLLKKYSKFQNVDAIFYFIVNEVLSRLATCKATCIYLVYY